MCNRDGSPLEAGFQTHSVGMGLIRDCALNGHDLLLSLNLGGHAKTNYGQDTCRNALTELLWEMRRQNEERKWNRQHAHGEGRGGFRLLSNRLQNETLESSVIVLTSALFAVFAAIALENLLCRSRFLDRRSQEAKGFESKPGRLSCCWSGACTPGSAMKTAGARRRWRPAERGFAMYRNAFK